MASMRERLSDRRIQIEYNPSIQRPPQQNRRFINVISARK